MADRVTDDFGVKTKDWITVQGDDYVIYVSDGSTVSVKKTDYGFTVDHVIMAANGFDVTLDDISDNKFEFRAGAMEFVRGWLRDNNLEMIPSADQAARRALLQGGVDGERTKWDHSYREKYDAKQTKPAGEPPKPVAEFDAAAFAASLLAPTAPTTFPAEPDDRRVMIAPQPAPPVVPRTRYWYHHNDDSLFTTDDGHDLDDNFTDELTAEEYAAAFARQLTAQLGGKPE